MSLSEATSGPDTEPSLPIWILAPAWILSYGAIFYGLPYVVAAVILWFRSSQWTTRQLRRWLWVLPGLFTIATVIVVAAINVLVTHDRDWPAYALDASRAAFAVGYSQAVLIACGEWIGTRAGWLTPGMAA